MRYVFFIFTTSTLLASSAVVDPHNHLIFPSPERQIVVASQDSCADSLPCGRILPDTDIVAKLVLEELGLPFHQSLLTVNQCLRNFIKDTVGPNLILSSLQGGGFARKGVILLDGSTPLNFPDLNFVDLQLTKENIAYGELDIYSHELGHVMQYNVWPHLPEGRSSKMHVSMGITDPFTAFREGWGEHFERMAYDHIDKYQKLYQLKHAFDRSTSRLWHSHMDTELRLNGVVHNDYIYRKQLPIVDSTGKSKAEILSLEHTSPLFDRCQLRSAQEMLASEGVIATLFYRITGDSALQHSYENATFYRPFLLAELPEGMTPQELFSPFENGLLKSAFIFSLLENRVDSLDQPFIIFLEAWIEQFPSDKERIISIFLLTTIGRTASNDLAPIFEEMAYYGMVGNLQKFKELSGAFQQEYTRLKNEVLSGKGSIDACVGPQLWVENTHFQHPSMIFFDEPLTNLVIDLNTATALELSTFPGISFQQAQQIVKSRDSLGHFESLEQAREAGFVVASAVNETDR